MRLLVLSHYFWPENFPINDFAAGLVEHGHEVTVVTPVPSYPEGRIYPGYGWMTRRHERYRGVEVVRVPAVPRGGGGPLRLALGYLSAALFACLKMPMLAARGYDACLVYQPSPVTTGLAGLVLRALTGLPLLVWVQDLWPQTLESTGFVRNRALLGMAGALSARVYRGADLLLVQSRAFRESLVAQGCDPLRIKYLPNTADALYRPVEVAPDSPAHELLPPGFRVLFAGNLGAAQDFESVLGAAERLRGEADLQWILMGAGRKEDWLAAEVARRGLEGRVHLPGRFPAAMMPEFFALADALLVTLHRDPIYAVTLPSKVQTYLACGRPIVGGLEGEAARVIQESGAGPVAPIEDPEALAAAVQELRAAGPEARREMGRRARRYYLEHFERDMLLTRVDRWLEELAGARQEAPCAG